MRLIAHRGASARLPENTLPAFHGAIADGADAIEFDVRLTADGVPVVLHDDDVSHATDGSGFVSTMRFDEVRTLDAAARSAQWNGGMLPIPTLDEVLAVVAGAVPIVVELKPAIRPDAFVPAVPVARAVVDTLRAVPGVVVSSFDAAAVELVRRVAPEIPTGLTGYRGQDDYWLIDESLRAGHRECHVAQAGAEPVFVERARSHGLDVLAFVVNEPGRARELEAIGVSAIFTDDPGGMRAALEDR